MSKNKKPGPVGKVLDFLAPQAAAAKAHSKAVLMEEVKLDLGNNNREPQSGEVVVKLDLDLVDPNPFQPRTNFDAVKALADSLRVEGQQYPILVRRVGDRYQVADGETRLRAFRHIHSQLGEVPEHLKQISAIVRVFSDVQMAITAYRTAYERRELNPIDEGEGFEKLKKEFGWSNEALAESIGQKAHYVRDRIKMIDLAPETKSFVRMGRIQPFVAMELDKAKTFIDERRLHDLLRLTAEQELTKSAVVNLVKSIKNDHEIAQIEANRKLSAEQKQSMIRRLQAPDPDEPKPLPAMSLPRPAPEPQAPPLAPVVYKNSPLRVNYTPEKDPSVEIQNELYSIFPTLNLGNQKRLRAYALELRAEQSFMKTVD